ncbi:DUF4232 domain-containing protein [Streptomyces sp. NPDC088733]|uniref:DUF4232 domain-containing protein n=1 Tax=Streptomyces sp. NPDC088733 TaxID=3365880 RepID=UPI0038138CCB
MVNHLHDGDPAQRHGARRTRRAGIPLLVGAALAMAVLTGCGKSGTGAGAPQNLPGSASPAGGDTAASAPPSQSSGTSSDDTATTPATPAAPSSPATGTGTTAAASTRCHTADLRASIGANNPGAGQENFPVVLTNRSSRTCTVYGFPGLAFVDSAGRQVTVDPERQTGMAKQRITLAPGASAWAPMTFSNPDISGATTVVPAAVLVTPPDERTSLRVPWNGGKVSNTGKASVPRIGPFQAGTGA